MRAYGVRSYLQIACIACRYEKLIELFPDNEDYKLYYAQSLFKV